MIQKLLYFDMHLLPLPNPKIVSSSHEGANGIISGQHQYLICHERSTGNLEQFYERVLITLKEQSLSL